MENNTQPPGCSVKAPCGMRTFPWYLHGGCPLELVYMVCGTAPPPLSALSHRLLNPASFVTCVAKEFASFTILCGFSASTFSCERRFHWECVPSRGGSIPGSFEEQLGRWADSDAVGCRPLHVQFGASSARFDLMGGIRLARFCATKV